MRRRADAIPDNGLPSRSMCILVIMRWASTALAVIVCCSLVLLQLSGLHVHVNVDADGPATHGAHIHGADSDGHDHGGDKDVAIVELGAGASKLLVFLVALLVALVVLPPTAGRLASHSTLPLPAGRRARWRPPLRAPPVASRH
jgi:hypothetical protein